MSAQPMLEPSKDVETPVAAAVVIPTVVTSDEKMVKFEAAKDSLRCACTALLMLAMVCSRPWPNAGWLGVFAAVAVLCASTHKLLWRARVARFCSAVVAVFAGIAFIALVTSINDMPQHVSDKVHTLCNSMPADTFEWGHTLLNEHHCARKGLAWVSSAMPHHAVAVVDKHKEAMLVAKKANSTSLVGAEQHWSQERTCDMSAHVAHHVVKMMMIAESLAHLLLFLAAVLVVKRACRLRCAAYKCGLLTWKKCGGCQCKATAATPPAAKELA